MAINRTLALPYVSFCVDTALAERDIKDMPANARLVGWQCGCEPLFVAVWSYLADSKGKPDRVGDDEAENIATDFLVERRWFAGDPQPADFIL